MSRHFFDCELRCRVRVRLGYDRPLKEFFLQVERIGADPDRGNSSFLYASSEDPFDGRDDLDYYQDQLTRLGLIVPESMFKSVQDDAAGDIGNRCAEHFSDGRIVEWIPK